MNFFKIKNVGDDGTNIRITMKKSKIPLNLKIFNKYDELLYELKNTDDKDVKYINNKIANIKVNYQKYFFSIFNIDLSNTYSLYSNSYKDDFYIEKLSNNGDTSTYVSKVIDGGTSTQKYGIVFCNMVNKNVYSVITNLKYCERENYMYNYRLCCFYNFFNCLEKNGIVYLTVFNYCNSKTFELIYLLTLMFENVIIYNSTYIYCENFLANNSAITKQNIADLIDKDFTIEPKIDLELFVKYLQKNIAQKNKNLELLLNKQFDKYESIIINEYFLNIKEQVNIKKMDDTVINTFQKYIIEHFKKIYITGKTVNISSNIKQVEGNFIIHTIEKHNFKNILEIGFAFGISAFYILSVPNTQLISIDPFQKTQWNNNGVKLLKNCGLDKKHLLITEKSYDALPKLLKKFGHNSMDLIFIDGWHTFDYTLVDFFYANLLLKENGIIIIDDALHNGVKKCVDYIRTNYLFYKKLESPITIACFKKIKDDNRDWNFHKMF